MDWLSFFQRWSRRLLRWFGRTTPRTLRRVESSSNNSTKKQRPKRSWMTKNPERCLVDISSKGTNLEVGQANRIMHPTARHLKKSLQPKSDAPIKIKKGRETPTPTGTPRLWSRAIQTGIRILNPKQEPLKISDSQNNEKSWMTSKTPRLIFWTKVCTQLRQPSNQSKIHLLSLLP